MAREILIGSPLLRSLLRSNSRQPNRSGSATDLFEPTQPDITLEDIWTQVKADLFAKEVQTSPTYSYQWMADQMGHIAIGAVITLLARWIGVVAERGLDRVDWRWPVGGLVVSIVFAVLKEANDARHEQLAAARIFDGRLDRRNLRDNTRIASWYMGLGGTVAAAAICGWTPWLFPILLGGALLPAPFWLRQKIRFQQVGLPFLFRLAEFDRKPVGPSRGPDDDLVTAIDDFVADIGSAKPAQHLVIAGELASGKSSLLVGLGTEAAFAGHKARYLTFTKLQELARDPANEPPAPRNTGLWPWTQSQLLLVDDVVRDVPGAEIDTPAALGAQLKALSGEVRAGIARRRTAWAIGDDIDNADQWACAIAEGLGRDRAEFICVRLAPRDVECGQANPPNQS